MANQSFTQKTSSWFENASPFAFTFFFEGLMMPRTSNKGELHVEDVIHYMFLLGLLPGALPSASILVGDSLHFLSNGWYPT